jgi:WD40 repeat protein
MDRGAMVLAALAASGCGAPPTQPGPLDAARAGISWRSCDALGAPIVDLAYSSDGRWLAAARLDGSVSVAELSGGGSRKIRREGGPPVRVALTEDGGRLAVAGAGLVTLYSVADGTMVRQLPVGAGDNVSLKFSDSPTPLLLAAFDRASNAGDNIKIWRASDGILVGSFAGSPRATFTYADEAALLVDEARGFEVLSFGGRVLRRVSFPRALSEVAFAPDGAYLGGVVRDDTGAGQVAVMSVADDTFLWISGEPSRSTRRLLFLENPSRVVQLGDRTLVHHQADGSLLTALPALDGTSPVAVASPDGETIAAIAADGTLALVSSTQGGARPGPPSVFGLFGAPSRFSASRDGRRLAIASAAFTWVVDLPDGVLVAAFESDQRAHPELSADGTLLALGGARRALYRLDGTGKELDLPVPPEDLPCSASLAVSPDGAFLAGGGCGRVELFRRDGTSMGRRPSSATAPAVVFSPDGSFLATSGPELWTVSDLRPVWPSTISPGASPVLAPRWEADRVGFSGDGGRLLISSVPVGAEGAETALLRAADGSVLRRFGRSLGAHSSLSRDGSWVAGSDGAFHLETQSRARLDPAPLLALFLPDLRIVAAGDRPQVRIFCPER